MRQNRVFLLFCGVGGRMRCSTTIDARATIWSHVFNSSHETYRENTNQNTGIFE
ncbi:hypothetical protein PF005_g5550 [Phytophthora fragariae]|uniref:Uncharacterized protein n=2 Tax=Phytophthora TaxID=4783 RepID=A0A6A3SYK7_9STRA|nr:hypothetical protein PF003_g13974 [Phytophthora fragariae]KAE9020188.1 hypothetical protein PR002_g12597 [Phytophthora rubi]KAE8941370.1 hypothetical protein PF009_g8850 [Phytophthora fragariae]KAE9041171.1 hypothetical protein PR001_g6735 [Phytophthora rubi]KAE9106709.1 hypothetical protein PF006_g21301 [Phytophthora fragariae]